MHIKYAIAGLTSITIAVITGIAFLSFSPKTCSCESIQDMLLASAGMPYPAELPGPEQLEKGLNVNFAGKIIRGGSDSYYFSACKQESPTRVTCNIATSQSMLLERGYNIVFVTDISGHLIKSHVSSYTSWL